ncbi:glycosyltransferase BC10-like [Senna tora]|uniref:Glycosyltransferase BC10-like n=1 Tax=Senna tora TaxID=362788 RepID=A0A834WK94_9FABA|nr:glycosyltransferase BC10-like [Senna tora]
MELSPTPSQWISKPFNIMNINHIYHLVFFTIGISLGIVTTLYFKSFSFQLQYFLNYHVTTPSSSSPLPQYYQPPAPPASAPDSSVSNTASNSMTRSKVFDLVHNMSDQELFLKAIEVEEGMKSNTSIPKVAFLFLAKGALPLGPLWEKFFKGNEDAERRLLANALVDDPSNERFVLLSESCIPLFNFTTIYTYLLRSSLSFLNIFDDPRKPGRGRYNPLMSPAINLTQWRKGSQWFELHRNLAFSVVSDTKYYPIFQKYCLPPCYMDEHYIPTFVHMMYGGMNSNRSVTFVDWSRGGPHPRKFGWGDVTDELLNGMSLRF